MRLGFVFATVSLFLAGCSAKQPRTSAFGLRHTPPTGAVVGRTNTTAVTVTPAPNTVYGKVAHVNASDRLDRKSTRLNSSHLVISYAVFCLKNKENQIT